MTSKSLGLFSHPQGVYVEEKAALQRGFESFRTAKSPGAILGFCDVEGPLLQIKKFAKRTLDRTRKKTTGYLKFY